MKTYILTSILFFSISCVLAQATEQTSTYDIQYVESVIVPIKVVKEKAIARRFYNELRTEISLGYLDNDSKKRFKVLVWVFTNPPIEHYRDRAQATRLVYNAHTGDFIGSDKIYVYKSEY